MIATAPLAGYATPQATEAFAAQAESREQIAQGHFKTFAGLRLSSLGMGSYLGQPTAGDDRQTEQALVDSVQSGAINVIDTAINYRFQRAERSIGRALRALQETHGVSRQSLFVASKNGFLTPDGELAESMQDFRRYLEETFIAPGIIQPRDIVGGGHCMAPAYLDHQLNRSLANLGLETLDLMYLHNAVESQLPELGKDVFLERLAAAFAFYESARRDGRIRYYGLATWNCFRTVPDAPEYLALAEVMRVAEAAGGSDHGFRFVQLPINFAFNEAATFNNQPVFEGVSSFLEAAQAYGVGVFASVPLLQGQLLNEETLPSLPGLETPAQACLQFVRSLPGVIAPLVGQKNPAHVRENLVTASVSPMAVEALESALA